MTSNIADLKQQLAELPAYDEANKFPLNNDMYNKMNSQLNNIREIVPQASPYTYFLDPADGQLHWLNSWAALSPDPNFTVPFRGLVSDVVDAQTVALMKQGLTTTVDQPPYSDDNGSWVSTYSPIKDADGSTIAAIGIDYPLSYVDEVRSGAIRVVVPLLTISYIVLLLLVLALSTWLTRPLKRLTAASMRIADGDYDVDFNAVVSTKVPDELAVLSESFMTMVDRVRIREQNLTQQVTRLKVEIDSKRKEESVNEIIESDFFAGIAEKAAIIRSRMKAADFDDGSALGTT